MNNYNKIFKKKHQFLLILKLIVFIFTFSLTKLVIANSVIAVVNDDIITFDIIAKQIKTTTTKAQKIALINQQIDLILQLKKVKKFGIKPKQKAIDAILNDIALKNNLSRAQLRTSLEFDSIVEDITRELSLRGLKQFVWQDIEVNLTQAEIDEAVAKSNTKISNFDKQIKIAQILINSIDQSNADTLQQSKDQLIKQFLIELSQQIDNDTSFASLAKLHSQDPSYKNGGESKWINPKQLPPILKKQIKSLKLGQLSEPFFAAPGWRIIKISKQRDAISTQLASIKSQLVQSQKNAYFKDWVKKLRKGVYIEIFKHKL